MTTLMISTLERRLLHTVSEEVEAEPVNAWPEQSLQLCLDLVRKIRENTVGIRQKLEELLSTGAEAHSFAQDGKPILLAIDDLLVQIGELSEKLLSSQDDGSRRLAAECRLLLQESQTYHDLLAEALSRASEAPRPINWERVRATEEAHTRGETKPFSRR